METEMKDIIDKSLEKAQDHDNAGNVGKAYAYYTVVAELCPLRRPEIEKAFTDVLCEWGMRLASDNRVQDVLSCYEHSLDMYPNNPRMLNNFAAHLLRSNDPMRAITYLKHALEVASDFLPAERNLQNAHSMAVARWHFPMLNDKERNNAFARAIWKRISQGYDTVLDVGTGTGLLSLYAKDAGAKEIYACECSSIMASIAQKVFENNGAEKIKLIPKLSLDLNIPDDIPERLKLIVTEIFDAGLFGEYIVPSIIDIHKNILKPDGLGIVIPMSATLYIAAVECEYIRCQSFVSFEKIKESCSLNFDNVFLIPDDEYYDTENLAHVKINYAIEPQVLLRVNFNNLSELQTFNEDGVKDTISAKCKHNGIVDGLITWFKLHLDEETTIDSSEGKSCWQLAVFPTIPMEYQENDILSIKAEMYNGKLKCSYVSEKSKPNIENKCIYRVPRDVIIFLNDFEYITSLIQVSKSHKSKELKNILDTSPFPIYGLSQLKESEYSENLYYETNNQTVRLLIKRVAENSAIKEKIRFITIYSEIECPLDCVLVHNFDITGELKDLGQSNCYEFFSNLLKPTGILLPEKIFLMGQLVFSEDLSKMISVKDVNLQRTSYSSNVDKDSTEDINIDKSPPYKIADYINEFKINQIFDLNSSLYLYDPFSEAEVLIEINETQTTESLVNFGKINITNKNLPNAVICWYKIKLTPDHIHETKRNKSFMNHMALVIEDELKEFVLQNKEVKIKVHQLRGLVSLKVLKI